MTTTALPDVFRKAADIIGERGWTRGTDVHPESGGVCANGALRLACGATIYNAENGNFRMRAPDDAFLGKYAVTMRNAHKVLNDRLDIPNPSEAVSILGSIPRIIWFNDRIAESAGEVQRSLRDAADWLESHPFAELAAVEDQPVPYAVTQAGYQAIDNKDLVLA